MLGAGCARRRQAERVAIHSLSGEIIFRVCDALTPSEACALLLGLGKHSLLFASYEMLSLLRGTAFGKRIATREGLSTDVKILEHILGRQLESTEGLAYCKEAARAWLSLPAPFCAGILTVPVSN